ncbi:MAG TPA: chromate efflux transporter [Puia sp.]|jgi:chromate transporter
MTRNKELKELAGLFLRLGLTAFGGPAVHIAMMQKEVVDRRGWMTHEHFLDLLGATQLIPGPNSTEMAIHIGQERGGWKGLLVAGACFILPAVFITGIIAWLYQLYGQVPSVSAWMVGMKPAIIAVILGAIFPLAKKALKNNRLIILGGAVLIAALMGANELAVMFGAGGIMLLISLARQSADTIKGFLPVVLLQAPSVVWSNARIFFIFLKIGALLYGSGYVLFAFLDNELVTTGLLSKRQLTDAIAIGQFTPGPVFSAVTFIGWQISGWKGAMLATLGVFLPSFVFVALLNPLLGWIRRSASFSAFLDGVNVAAIALVLSVCITLGRGVIGDWRTVLIGLLSLAVVFGRPRTNSAFVILGGILLGYLLQQV